MGLVADLRRGAQLTRRIVFSALSLPAGHYLSKLRAASTKAIRADSPFSESLLRYILCMERSRFAPYNPPRAIVQLAERCACVLNGTTCDHTSQAFRRSALMTTDRTERDEREESEERLRVRSYSREYDRDLNGALSWTTISSNAIATVLGGALLALTGGIIFLVWQLPRQQEAILKNQAEILGTAERISKNDRVQDDRLLIIEGTTLLRHELKNKYGMH